MNDRMIDPSPALPDVDEAQAVPTASALPEGFLARMERMLGADYPAFLASYDKPLHPSLRLNPLKLDPADEGSVRALLPFLGEAVPWVEGGYYYDPDGDVRPGKHPFHEAGLYYIQEASAMIPASLCPPEPGMRVLDLCAAPGGKATQLAGALRGQGLLVANEIVPNRAAILSQNIERLGIPNAVVTNEPPAALAARFPAFFDRVVVDAPCSGEGMFRKEAQAVTMWSRENVEACAARQREILTEAAKMLAPGGYLVYSTCTFAPEENEGTLAWFLSAHPDFSAVEPQNPRLSACLASGLADRGRAAWIPDGTVDADALTPGLLAGIAHSVRLFPHHADGEGHFAVLLHRSEDSVVPTGGAGGRTDNGRAAGRSAGRRPERVERNEKRGGRPSRSRPDETPAARALSLFDEFAASVLTRRPEGIPMLFGDNLYLLPPDAGMTADALDRLHVLRAGLQLGSVKGGRFEPSHALALTLGAGDAASFALDPDGGAASAYLRGEALPCPDALRGWHIVTLCGRPLGWGKASGGMMKNHYPKGLRR